MAPGLALDGIKVASDEPEANVDFKAAGGKLEVNPSNEAAVDELEVKSSSVDIKADVDRLEDNPSVDLEVADKLGVNPLLEFEFIGPDFLDDVVEDSNGRGAAATRVALDDLWRKS